MNYFKAFLFLAILTLYDVNDSYANLEPPLDKGITAEGFKLIEREKREIFEKIYQLFDNYNPVNLFPFSELNTVITSDASFLDSSSFSLQEHKSLLKPNTQQSVNSLLGIYKNLFHAWGKNIETMEGTIKSWEENAGLKKESLA